MVWVPLNHSGKNPSNPPSQLSNGPNLSTDDHLQSRNNNTIVAYFRIYCYHFLEMDTCDIWKSDVPATQEIRSSCGIVLSPNFPGVAPAGYWLWKIDSPYPDSYITFNVHYIKGPGRNTGDCEEYVRCKWIDLFCMFLSKQQNYLCLLKLTCAICIFATITV